MNLEKLVEKTKKKVLKLSFVKDSWIVYDKPVMTSESKIKPSRATVYLETTLRKIKWWFITTDVRPFIQINPPYDNKHQIHFIFGDFDEYNVSYIDYMQAHKRGWMTKIQAEEVYKFLKCLENVEVVMT